MSSTSSLAAIAKARGPSPFLNAIGIAVLMLMPVGAKAQSGRQPRPLVSPKRAHVPVPQNAPGTARFVISNHASIPRAFTLTCASTGTVSQCAAPPSMTIGARASATAVLTFRVGDTGSGSVTLTASADGASDHGTYAVVMAAPRLLKPVLPDSMPLSVSPNSGVNVAAFKVWNGGSEAKTYAFRAACTGLATACGTPAPVTVAPGSTAPVFVTFVAGAAGEGSLELISTTDGASDRAAYRIMLRRP